MKDDGIRDPLLGNGRKQWNSDLQLSKRGCPSGDKTANTLVYLVQADHLSEQF